MWPSPERRNLSCSRTTWTVRGILDFKRNYFLQAKFGCIFKREKCWKQFWSRSRNLFNFCLTGSIQMRLLLNQAPVAFERHCGLVDNRSLVRVDLFRNFLNFGIYAWLKIDDPVKYLTSKLTFEN
jgi:hypothetical protein